MPSEIDYKELLIKYMHNVGEEEGGYAIPNPNSDFTKSEIEALLDILIEVRSRYAQ